MSEQGYNSFKDSEKGCLQFLFHSEEPNAKGEQRHVLVERYLLSAAVIRTVLAEHFYRYTNAAALRLHRENPAHGELMRKLGEFDFLAATPIMYEGSATFGHAQGQAS